MKRSFEGLSLEIRELKNKFVIIVEDNADKSRKYKHRFEANKTDKKAIAEILNDSKEWLWNMGCYNGQANEMCNKYDLEWQKALGLLQPQPDWRLLGGYY